jgi:hypothetical protein
MRVSNPIDDEVVLFKSLEHWIFEFVSDFDIRISNFPV